MEKDEVLIIYSDVIDNIYKFRFYRIYLFWNSKIILFKRFINVVSDCCSVF